MCGIVGVLSFNDSPFEVSESYLINLRDTMAHRGPDGAGVWIAPDKKIGLGHRRLSIIDLSDTANQPMCNEDGSIWVVFNGEIYNHADIRKELEELGGHTWKTNHSDTEVILHAFEHWGIDCLHRFRGMFAIAIWDSRNQELWLVRDRTGIKPLYYSIHNGRIVFASEIKALLRDPEQIRAVNEEGFFHYMSFLTVPAPGTLFDGIYKLPCATWMCIDTNGNIKEHQYWDVLDHTKPLNDKSDEEIASQLLSELRTAVQLLKASDVPVGIFLSGGIDSSTNAALFSENHAGEVKTFSIGYEGDYQSYQNELHHARAVAEKVGAQYHEKLLNISDLINFLPEMVHLQDEPIGDSVCVPCYYVAKLARDNGVTVCQVGEGADELFWGYSKWKMKLRLQKLDDIWVPRIFKRMVVKTLSLLGWDDDWRYEYLRRSSCKLPIFWGGAESYTHTQKMQLLSPRMKKRFANRTSWEAIAPIRKRFEEKSKTKSHLDWMTYIDLNMRLPELLLMRVDKMSMGVSLEGRVPFLDHKFVELAMSIPPQVKTRNGTLKYILKKAVRGIIPDEIIDRKKQGFAAPMQEWFDDRLADVAKQELKDFCHETDLLDWSEIKKLLESEKRERVWPLLNVAQWWNHYIKNSSQDTFSSAEPTMQVSKPLPLSEMEPAVVPQNFIGISEVTTK
ncbi:asparagine synthase [Legionella lansingensis]|uniref:asparagine synthase (glutamine-hydrolyzing) n=1 Tax=Legionella lansingensis TaxID=45067 RepID=A0A0W0VWB7_9GAMM|nr:asparagine synthase (glutamine-hydrolyzing) [Legionella lansingensis]KTD24330.1 asparagine synthase [Legionella lansingensis]SNV51774.1 asparagine synthase [Legionella lansingensis]